MRRYTIQKNWKVSILGPKTSYLPHFWHTENFPQKVGFVTFCIREKTLQTNGQTEERTDKAEFIEPFDGKRFLKGNTRI